MGNTSKANFVILTQIGSSCASLSDAVLAYFLVRLPLLQGYLVLLGTAFVTVLANLSLSVLAESPSPPEKRCFTLMHALVAKFDLRTYAIFPWKYWLAAFVGVMAQGFRGFANAAPTFLHNYFGLTAVQANSFVGIEPVIVMVFGPIAAYLYKKFPRCCGPMLTSAAGLIVFRMVLDGLLFDVASEWIGWIFLGLGIACTNVAAKHLIAEALQGKEELIPQALGIMFFLGLLVQSLFASFGSPGHE